MHAQNRLEEVNTVSQDILATLFARDFPDLIRDQSCFTIQEKTGDHL